jgi:hypothetical protein
VVDPDDLARRPACRCSTQAIGIRLPRCVALKMTQSALTYPRAKLEYEDFVNR